MSTTAAADGPGRSQEPAIHSESLTQVVEPQALESSPAVSQNVESEARAVYQTKVLQCESQVSHTVS